MTQFKINQQTEAERDDFLVDCFHDAGFIKSLMNSNLSIISGRKGTGKTALARYLEKKGDTHGIVLAYRISVRNISINRNRDRNSRLNSILFFVIIKTVQKLLSEGIFSGESEKYWKEFLNQNELQNVSDYETFVEFQKTKNTGFSIKGCVSSLLAKVDGSVNSENESKLLRSSISKVPHSLIESLRQSLPESKPIFIFIDDMSDYLDDVNESEIDEDINLIRDFLLSSETYNSLLIDMGKKLRFVSLIRDDIFEFMQGSNINKLRSNSLMLEWDERSFAGLLIRRLSFYQNNLNESLKNPIESLKKQFPDNIFSKTLEEFDTNRYHTNFYAYMVAVSFNRPRDFLMFCYAMRDRLSLKNPVNSENIESAEIEYSDYFRKELKDELYLASRILKCEFSSEKLNQLVDILSQKNGFNSAQLKTDLSKYLGEKTSIGKNKIENFIQELWWYGMLGFKDKKEGVINFRYIVNHTPFVIKKIKDYIFYLHRGLWWFSKKRKK